MEGKKLKDCPNGLRFRIKRKTYRMSQEKPDTLLLTQYARLVRQHRANTYKVGKVSLYWDQKDLLTRQPWPKTLDFRGLSGLEKGFPFFFGGTVYPPKQPEEGLFWGGGGGGRSR